VKIAPRQQAKHSLESNERLYRWRCKLDLRPLNSRLLDLGCKYDQQGNEMDPASLTKQQLTALLWELKGTSAAYPIYQELRIRTSDVMIKLSDPDWENKTDKALKQALGITTPCKGRSKHMYRSELI
jgi:hypothetical protein